MAAFHWTLLDASRRELGSTEDFDSQEEAESWMGQEWSRLLDEGAELVALVSAGRVLYRMGLREQ